MKFLADMALGKKITLLVVLGLLIGIGVFAFLGVRAIEQAVDNALQDRMVTAYLVASFIDEELSHAINELKYTAQMMAGVSAESELQNQIDTLDSAYSRLSIYTRSLWLVNESGQVLWSKPRSTTVDHIDISVYPCLFQSLKSGEVCISNLIPEPVSKVPVILLVSPIEGRPQGSRSLIVVAIDITAKSSITGFVQPIKLGKTGYIEIVDQNGVVMSRTKPGTEPAPFERSDHSSHFAALIADGRPTRGVCHTCHELVQKVERNDVLAFVPLSRARWGVVIRQSEAEVFAPINELSRNLLLSGIGLLIIAFTCIIIITSDIRNRIKILIVASRRVAMGDFSGSITIPHRDELGILAETFDTMRADLSVSYRKLEQRTNELSSLLSISEILSSLLNLSDLNAALDSALNKTLEIMKWDTGGILLFDEEKQELYYQVYRGLSRQYIEDMRLRLGEGIAGKVAQTGEAVFVEDILSAPDAIYPALVKAEGIRAFASVPLRSKERTLGVINIISREPYSFSSGDKRLLGGIAQQIGIAIENAELHKEVQHKEENRGELLHEILSIQEEERRRIARELHDETSQVLASLNANLEATVRMLPPGSDKAEAMLRKGQALSISILEEIHRIIYELRPTLLDDLGLVAATRWLLDKNLATLGIKVDFRTVGKVKRLPPQLEAILFRVIQEAVNNISRHAHARRAELSIGFKSKIIGVHIRDDGRGFNVEEAINSKDRPRGLGLLGMKERIELVKGTLRIKSDSKKGTTIQVQIPLDKEV